MNSRPLDTISTLAVVAFAAIAGTFSLRAYDLFWHLATGRWILEHRALPDIDPFRFTSENIPWVDHEWLFQVMARGMEQIGGLDGMVLFRAAIVVLIAMVLLFSMRRNGTPQSGAVIITAGAVLLARPRFMMRPELFSLLALALLIALLQEYRRSHSRSGTVGMALLVVLWANIHPGVIIAPIVSAAFLLGGFMLGGTQPYRGRVDFLSVLTVPVALAGAVLINPVGFKLYLVPFEIRAALSDLGAVNPEWQSVWSAPQPALFAGVAALVIVVVWTLLRARRIDAATTLSTLALGALAASGVRHQGLLFVGAAFLAGECMADVERIPRTVVKRSDTVPNAIAMGVCLTAALWCIWTPSSGPLRARQGPYVFGLGLEPGRYPVEAVEALETRPYIGPMYNDVAFGGYLAWRLYPRRVFIDGRNEVNVDLLRQVVGARSDSRTWTALLDEFGIDRAMVRYDDRLIEVTDPSGNVVSRRTPNALLFPSSSFALVYWDDVSMVFVRRTDENRERIELDEYRFVHPEDRLRTIEAAATDPAFRNGVLDELERRLEQEPKCVRAQALRNDLTEATAGS